MVKEFENFWHIQTHESPSIRQTGDSSSWSDTEHLSLHVYLPYQARDWVSRTTDHWPVTASPAVLKTQGLEEYMLPPSS